jgi:hypothetical protein
LRIAQELMVAGFDHAVHDTLNQEEKLRAVFQ